MISRQRDGVVLAPLAWNLSDVELGSGLIDQSQKATAAAIQIADK